MKKLFTFFSLLLLIASCAKDSKLTNSSTSTGAVSFTATVVEVSETKATLKYSWSEGDCIALFVDGLSYQYAVSEDGTMDLIGVDNDLIVDRDVEHTYIAFYPFDMELSSLSDYESASASGEVDYMRAEITSSANAVELQFYHELAAVTFEIYTSEEPTAVKLALDGIIDDAVTLNVETTEGEGEYKLVANYFVEDGTSISSALLLLEKENSTTVIPLNSEDTNTLEAGKKYTFLSRL